MDQSVTVRGSVTTGDEVMFLMRLGKVKGVNYIGRDLHHLSYLNTRNFIVDRTCNIESNDTIGGEDEAMRNASGRASFQYLSSQ